MLDSSGSFAVHLHQDMSSPFPLSRLFNSFLCITPTSCPLSSISSSILPRLPKYQTVIPQCLQQPVMCCFFSLIASTRSICLSFIPRVEADAAASSAFHSTFSFEHVLNHRSTLSCFNVNSFKTTSGCVSEGVKHVL